jgi:hypothetical protein
MTTENDEVHGTVIDSGYYSEPEADPTTERSDQASEEDPDGVAEDDASPLDPADGDRLPGTMEEPADATEDDERYLTAADSSAEDGSVLADSTGEGDGTLADSTGEGDGTLADSSAEDDGTLADSSAEDGSTLADSSAEDGSTLADSTGEDGSIPAQRDLASAEDGTDAYDSEDDEEDEEDDEDEIIVVESADAGAGDVPSDTADDEIGEVAVVEAVDEETLAADTVGGEAAVPDTMTAAQAAPAPAHARMPSDTEYAGLAGDPEEMRRRWASIQSSFVDDPRESVSEAANYLSEVMATLVANAQERERELRAEWDGGGLDTESLRTTLRQYRGFIDRLAAL